MFAETALNHKLGSFDLAFAHLHVRTLALTIPTGSSPEGDLLCFRFQWLCLWLGKIPATPNGEIIHYLNASRQALNFLSQRAPYSLLTGSSVSVSIAEIVFSVQSFSSRLSSPAKLGAVSFHFCGRDMC